MKASRNKSGFTLVELLVVISIIALLVSILMPALGRARSQARKVVCSANLHNLNIVMMLYQDTYNGFPAVWWSTDGYERELWWEPLVRGGLLPEAKEESTVSNGYEDLKIDLGQAEAYTCPEWPRWAKRNRYASDVRFGMGYAYNWHLSPILQKNGGVEERNLEYTGKNPKGATIVFIDSPSFFMDAFHFRPYDPELAFTFGNGNIATWHNGDAVSAWADGHVEALPAGQYKIRMLAGGEIARKYP